MSTIEKEMADQITRDHKIGDITIQAVQRVTDLAATEIETVADQVDKAANDLSSIMRELAVEMRKHGEKANQELAAFVAMANAAKTKAVALSEFIKGGGVPPNPPTTPPANDLPK